MTYTNSTTKNCTDCKTDKDLTEFHKSNKNKDGLQGKCKPCANRYKRDRKITKEGVITSIYGTQRKNSRKRLHNAPNYSNIELRLWAFEQPIFHEIYDRWVASEYLTEKVPSFDRYDDYLPYTLDNIHIVTWQENNEKGCADRVNGVNNKASKAIIKMDLSGNKIKEYYSMRHAGRILGINNAEIYLCCRGKRKIAGGYKWMYA